MSRVDSAYVAYNKLKRVDIDNDLMGSVLASDAFFPFPDVVELVASWGVKAIVHPGGSRNDSVVNQKAKQLGIAMYHSGIRHFNH